MNSHRVPDDVRHFRGHAGLHEAYLALERAQDLLRMSRAPGSADRREKSRADALAAFQQAQVVADRLVNSLDTEYVRYKKQTDKLGIVEQAQRRALLKNLIASRLHTATTMYEHSRVFELGSPDQQRLARSARDKSYVLYERYRKKITGIRAGMLAGRCRQDLGDLAGALRIYEGLLLQPDQPQIFREIKGQTVALTLTCWLDERQKQYDRAADTGEKWLQAAGMSASDEDRRRYGLQIRYLTAVAIDKQLDTLHASLADRQQIKRRTAALYRHAEFLLRCDDEHLAEVRALLTKHSTSRS